MNANSHGYLTVDVYSDWIWIYHVRHRLVIYCVRINQSMSLIQTTKIHRKKHRTQTQEKVTHMIE